jgi:hypothetical protein
MFRTFIDDSGSHRNPSQRPRYFALAGYLMPADRWGNFSDAWAAILARNKAIRCCKMADAESGEGYFQGIEEPFRKLKVKELSEVIHSFAPMGFGCYLKWEDYKNIVERRVPSRLDSAYAILFYQIIRGTHEWQIERNKALGCGYEKVDFIFDEQGNAGLQAAQWYAPLKANMAEPYRQMMSGPPEFEDDEEIVALQAADMLAWHVRREQEYPDEHRAVSDTVMRHYTSLEIDTDALRDFVGLCKRVKLDD